jgi:hypothetical protein
MSDALGKATFVWCAAAFLWWLGVDRYGHTVPALDPADVDRLLMRELPFALAWGWGAHQVNRRAAGDSSFAEVVGLATFLIVFGVGRGIVQL